MTTPPRYRSSAKASQVAGPAVAEGVMSSSMSFDRVLEAFRHEAQELSRAVAELPQTEWDLPTRCAPWSVRELLGHVRVVIAWLPGMLATPPPNTAEVSATQYYRPDDRFAPATNTARIGLAQQHAASQPSGTVLAADFATTWWRAYSLCRNEPPDRLVCTRHGDAMLLSQFLITRVLEIAVHGLDIADALERDPWLTRQAGDVVLELLLGPGHEGAERELGWDRPCLLRKATGRSALDDAGMADVARLGIQWLTLG